MTDGEADAGEMLAKAGLSVIVILVLLFDPLPGDEVLAPPIVGAIWGAGKEGE